MIKKHNDWSAETYFLFFGGSYSDCWWCGTNRADCGHHIFGRGRENDCENSPLNFAPLCNHRCHLPNHGYLMTAEGRNVMFKKTLDYLVSINYQLTDKDNRFLEKYKDEIAKMKL